MIDLLSLIKDTNAYRTIKGDKSQGRLSHAYLLLTSDGENLDEYLKIFAKLIFCDETEPCGECRKCKLIDSNEFADMQFFPKNNQSITTEDVNYIIEESYIKPIEGEKKLFILSHAENMNAPAQNKLLKTLEEPPKNVHIIMGATSEFPILSTVKSRVKKIEIPVFDKDKLFVAMNEDYPDRDRLLTAIACGDGTIGKVKKLYADEKLQDLTYLCVDTLINMKSSKDLLDYSTRILSVCPEVSEFISVMELVLRDFLALKEGQEKLVFNKNIVDRLSRADNFSRGAIIYALDSVNESVKRKKFNANPTMLIEWLLFKILEGKYKWQKL